MEDQDAEGRRACDNDGADEKHTTQSAGIGKPSERWAGDPQREIEKRRVCAHGDAAALGRRQADRFNAEAGVHKRVAQSGERHADERPRKSRRSPDQDETGGLDQHAAQGDRDAAHAIRHVAECHTRDHERGAEGRQRDPRLTPSTLSEEQVRT